MKETAKKIDDRNMARTQISRTRYISVNYIFVILLSGRSYTAPFAATMARPRRFWQILAIARHGGAYLSEERKALYFTRILDCLLRLVYDAKSQERLDNGRNYE